MLMAALLRQRRAPLPRASLHRGLATPARTLCSATPPSASGDSSRLRQAWAAYVRALEARPLRVKVASAAVIFSTGDLSTQYLVEKSEARSIDLMRTARMAAFGCLVTAWVHNWWGILEPLATSVFHPQTQRVRNTMFKVACDQTFGAGSFNFIFFTQTALMEGEGVSGAMERVRTQWWPQMQRHWCFWPWFHSFNFYHNPLHLRVLWQNLALVGWSALLSSVGAAAVSRAGDEYHGLKTHSPASATPSAVADHGTGEPAAGCTVPLERPSRSART